MTAIHNMMQPLVRTFSNSSIKSTASSGSKRSHRSSSSSSSSSYGASAAARRVRFGPLEHHEIEEIDWTFHSDVYYSQSELKDIRKHEVSNIRKAIKELGHNDLDSVEGLVLTWRGIEDFRDGINKQVKTRYHVQEVLKECKRQERGRYIDSNALRAVSKHLSRQDKQTALQKAIKDAEFVGHKGATTTLSAMKRRGSFKKTLNSALNLLQQAAAATTASSSLSSRPRPVSNTAA